ncbi:MAG: hypothetical protein U0Q15_15085 [Kineosporiaceae bacterium]
MPGEDPGTPRSGRGRRYRYGAWRGGPDPLAPPVDLGRALDALGEDVLNGSGLREALRDLLRRGLDGEDGRRRAGLDELRARAQRMRREAARRGRLDGTLTRARGLLDQAVAAEREALAADEGLEADFARARLDGLPRSVASAVQELSDYSWRSPEAAAMYRAILDDLRGDVLDRQFAGLRQALQGMGPNADPQQRDAATAAMKEMLGDLNDLLARQARGEDTDAAFEQFMQRHGELFPENPESVEELVDALARRAAAGQRLMASLTPQQREELAQLMDQALGDPDLAREMAALNDTLRALRPDLTWDRGERVRGDQPLGYGEATQVLGELSDLDDLLDSLAQDSPGATLDDVDVDAVSRTLGTRAAEDVRALQELERELQRQGWLTRTDAGLQLSPKALRRLGQSALRQVFAHLSARGRGEHDVRQAGAAGEVTGASRPWQFGDEQPIDVVASLGNALRRQAGERAAVGVVGGSVASLLPLRLRGEDVEVVETQRRSGASVALCVDLSYSMISEGRWGPMKQTALALAHLVATRFPQDALQIIGFGRHAAALTVEQLAGIEPDYVQGTNLQHALKLAQRHLRRHPDGEPVVLVVTDGEPTAHLTAGGQARFSWPPTPETVELTVAEVDALTRFGAAINVFMLGDDPGLQRFMDAVARRNGGCVFTPSPDRLGQFVVSDYLRARQGRRRG